MYQAIGAVLGAGLGAYGASQQRQAMGHAADQYSQQLRDYYAREQADNAGFQKQYEDIGNRRLNRVGTALTDYMATPYGQTGADTGTAQKALSQVSGGANPGTGLGGAATGWGNGVAERTGAATGRQMQIAGDASQLRRQGQGQSAALQSQGVADMGFQRENDNVAHMERLRQAVLAQQLQALNANAQGTFDQAGRVGSDNMAIAGYLGAGGGLIDSFGGGGAAKKPGAQQANPNWGPTGQQSGGGYYGAITPSASGWGPRGQQVGGGYYGSLFQ